MANNNLKLSLEIAASGAGATVQELLNVRRAIEATAAQSGGISQLARAMGTNYEAAKKFADGLKLTPEAAAQGIARLRELNAVGASSEIRFATLTAQMGVTVRQFQALDRAARQGGQGQAEGINLAGQGLAALAFKLNNIIQLFQTLAAAAKPAYDLLIDSNERLNAQLLSSQANLASTSRLFAGGQEITDPTAKIQASRSALQGALKQIEKDTESLVGVTSSQVNELFQITLQNAAALNNQSKQFPDAISAATSLTKGWAASLNVVGVPLNQARQEINSILKGQVDSNSVLAKSLNITNEQVRQWQSQGRLVDELNKKLENYVAGNALAARSIAGIGSNIQDVIERLGRSAGEPLLEPIINLLDQIYNGLKANEEFLTAYFKTIVEQGIQSVELFGGNFRNTFEQLGEITAELSIVAGQLFTIIGQGAAATGIVLDPLISTLGRIINLAVDGYKKIGDLILFRQIADQQEALDALFEQSNKLQDAALQLATKLNLERKNGQQLSASEIAAAKSRIASLDAQIQALKETTTVSTELTAARDQEIKRLEATKKKLDEATGGLTIQAKELENLGTAYEQLEKKAAAANRNIETGGGGDPEVFKKSVTELVKTTELQAKLRQVNLESAAKTLEQIRSDTRVEVDVQQQAKETITKIYADRVAGIKQSLANGVTDQRQSLQELIEIRDRAQIIDDPKATAEIRKKAAQEIIGIVKQQGAAELAEIEASKGRIEALQAAQRLGEAEGDRQLTVLKRQELLKRIEQNQALQENSTSAVERQQLLAERAKINADLDKLAGDYQKRVNQRILADYDEQLVELEEFNNLRLISEQDYQAAKTATQSARADKEIEQLRGQLARLSAADAQGREAINTQISKLQIQKIKILEDGYAAELVLIKDAQAQALDLVLKSEQQRSIELQKLVNDRSIRQETADKERSRQKLSQQQAELKQATDFEAALARTANAVRSPEAERAYQQQVRDARAKTLQITLNLLQTEGVELDRLRGLVLKGIEDEVAARNRAVDRQLSQISQVRQERDRQAKSAEANTAREVAALDVVTKVLERQNALLQARTNLQKAKFDATASGESLELQKVTRSLEIRKKLDTDTNLLTEERVVLLRELRNLAGNEGVSEFELIKRKVELERQQAVTKRESIEFEQTAAKASLSLEQQKIGLANQRALIEARIAEFKAKQSILDAQLNARQQELNNKKSIEAAQLAVEQAKAQQPGQGRDRAVADAEAKLAIARSEAKESSVNAAQSIEFARQSASLAAQTTQQAIEQVKSQSEVNRIQNETLGIQQQMVLKQLEAAEAARKYADELERARAAALDPSERIIKPLVFEARARGGSVNAGQPYVVGENSPEVFVPNVSGTVLNREQILKNLGSLGGLNLNVAAGQGADNREVISAIRSLQQTIQSRPPTPIVANFNAADDGQLDKLFAIQRSALRIS